MKTSCRNIALTFCRIKRKHKFNEKECADVCLKEVSLVYYGEEDGCVNNRYINENNKFKCDSMLDVADFLNYIDRTKQTNLKKEFLFYIIKWELPKQ